MVWIRDAALESILKALVFAVLLLDIGVRVGHAGDATVTLNNTYPKYLKSCVAEWDRRHPDWSCPVAVDLKSCEFGWQLPIGEYFLIFERRDKALILHAARDRFLVRSLIGVKFSTLPKIKVRAQRDGDMITNTYEVGSVDTILSAVAISKSINLYFEEKGSVTVPITNNVRSAFKKLEHCNSN